MNLRIVMAGVLGGAFALAVASGGTAREGPTQPSQLPLVQLSLIVTDSSDHSIESVRKEDVRVLEDGVPQSLIFLERDDRPIRYGIAIDGTGSFRRVIQAAINAAKAIVKNNQSDDETFLERFVDTNKIEIIQDFTTNPDKIAEGLDSIYVEGGRSAIIDAVYMAVEHIAEPQKGADNWRQALVLITDGEDRGSYYQLAALEKLLTEKNVQVFVIGFVSEVKVKPSSEEKKQGHRSRDEAISLVKRIAEVTGGRAFFPDGITDLNRAVSEINHDLRNQYSLAYQPSGRTPGFHKITIEITAPAERDKLIPIARPGYFIPLEKTKEKKSQ